ncbi:hypothetical protein JXA80_11790 [bacterium]|nr:hypothetical protein [candidate division CSSED10-310 bacterium]
MGSLGGDTEKEPQSYSLIREFWDFLKHSKRWWLLPILIIMALLSVFIILSAEAPALMIYSMF